MLAIKQLTLEITDRSRRRTLLGLASLDLLYQRGIQSVERVVRVECLG